jgi:hypothetical protein
MHFEYNGFSQFPFLFLLLFSYYFLVTIGNTPLENKVISVIFL